MSAEHNKSVPYTRLEVDDDVDQDEVNCNETSSLVQHGTGGGDSGKIKNGYTKDGEATYSDAVEAAGFGKFHALLLIVCGWANMSDAVEILSVSFLLPNASVDMNINSVEKGALTSIIFVGMLVGGYLWGSLADIRGRRQILIYSLTCNAFFGAASSVCQNFWLFLVMRFLSGVGVGGSIPVIFSYFGEFQPNNHRGKMISGLSTFWMGGNILTAALAWAIIPRDIGYHNDDGFSYESWRIFVAVCCVPAASSVITFMIMPESPKYLLEQGNEEKALAIMRNIYSWNHKGAKPSDYPVTHLIPSGTNKRQLYAEDGTKLSLWKQFLALYQATKQLFKKPLTGITIAMLVIIFNLSFGYYGLFMWFPELFKRVEYGGSACSTFNESINITEPSDRIYVDGFYTALSNLPGNLLTIVLMDRLSRKLLITSSMIISGISVFFIWFLETRTHVLIMSCLFGAISVITWNTLNVVGVELYPTSCRSTALGVQSVLNRLGAIIGSLMFGVLIDLNCAIPMILIAVLLAIGGLTALALPNTSKKELK
nr:synaptic vesicle glycoprotein 2B-like [Lytechinus pictus]